MKILTAFGLVLALSGSAGVALADQTDPRLPSLFDSLRLAPNAQASSVVEQAIWQLWLQTDDEDIGNMMSAGTAAMRRGDLDAALATFDTMVERAPDFAEGWNKRATVHFMLDNFDESLADIEATLMLEPRHFGALSGRGLVFLRMREPEKALQAFEEALEVGPQMPGIRSNIEALREVLGVRDI